MKHRLGAGGMGEVVLAHDPALGRSVAMKRILGEATSAETIVARFLEEARITAQLDHPNIVPVHELDVDPAGNLYFTMKEVRGRTLEEVVRAEGASLPEILRAFLKVCDAVGFAHSRGVIHRDLKPANVMIGDFGEVLVLDWGLAKTRNSELGTRNPEIAEEPETAPRGKTEALRTQEGAILGSPAYMSPEQARDPRSADERSDIYLLGGILYHILTAQAPHRARKRETARDLLDRIQSDPVEPPSRRATKRNVPRELEAIAMKSLAMKRAARYAEVRSLQADIEAYLDGRRVAAARYRPLEAAWKWVKRHRHLAVTCAALAVLSSLFASYLAYRATGEAHAEEEREAAAKEEERARRGLEEDIEREREAERGKWREPIYASEPGWADAKDNWRAVRYDRPNERFVEAAIQVEAGELRLTDEDNMFAAFRQPVSGNVKLEFESYVEGNGGNVNCFVCGREPDLGFSGYMFQLGTSGNTYSRLFRRGIREVERTDGFRLVPGQRYHVVARIEDNQLNLEVDGRTVLVYEDTLSLTGQDNALVGFHTYSSDIRIRNARIYLQTLPLKRRTILQADDHLRAQNFHQALSLYDLLRVNYSGGRAHTEEEELVGIEATYKLAMTHLTRAQFMATQQNKANEARQTFETAVRLFQEFAKDYPNSYYAPFALFEVAQVLFSQEHYSESLGILDQIETLHRESPVARVHVRGFYREAQLHLFDEQLFGENEYLPFLQRYLRFEWGTGGMAGGYYRLGLAYLYLARFREAREAFQRVLRDFPHENHVGQARAMERAMVENNAFVYMGLGRLYRDAEDFDGLGDQERFTRALEYFTKARDLSRQDSNKLIHQMSMADAQVFMGRAEEALRTYAEAIRDFGAADAAMSAETHLRMGNLLRSLKRNDEALHAYDAIAQLGDRDRAAAALLQEGDLLDHMDRAGDAHGVFRQVINDYADRALPVAIARFRLGDGTLDALLTAAETTPRVFKDAYLAYLFAARRRVLDGDRGGARKLYERAIERSRFRDRGPVFLDIEQELRALGS